MYAKYSPSGKHIFKLQNLNYAIVCKLLSCEKAEYFFFLIQTNFPLARAPKNYER